MQEASARDRRHFAAIARGEESSAEARTDGQMELARRRVALGLGERRPG